MNPLCSTSRIADIRKEVCFMLLLRLVVKVKKDKDNNF